MIDLNLTKRQTLILSIALTNLYDEIAKSGEEHQMKLDVMELAKLIQTETSKELDRRN